MKLREWVNVTVVLAIAALVSCAALIVGVELSFRSAFREKAERKIDQAIMRMQSLPGLDDQERVIQACIKDSPDIVCGIHGGSIIIFYVQMGWPGKNVGKVTYPFLMAMATVEVVRNGQLQLIDLEY